MPSRRVWLFFLATVVIAGMHLTWSYNELPERVASHFDGHGHPNGWSSREGFAVTYVLLIVTMAGMFAGITWLIRRVPTNIVSMPNRDYWFAPERREATCRRLGDYLLVMGGVTTLFNVGIMHLTVQANRSLEPGLGESFWFWFGAYSIFMVVWMVFLLRSFRVPSV